MKKLIAFLFYILLINSLTLAQYRINKTKYDYQSYIPLPGDPYPPAAAGFASLLIPGLGQAISGEPGRGFVFFGGSVGCLILAASALEIHNPDIGQRMAILSGVGIVGLWIWSIADAPRVAKVNNLAWRDKYKSSMKLEFLPNISTMDFDCFRKYSTGMTLKFSF